MVTVLLVMVMMTTLVVALISYQTLLILKSQGKSEKEGGRIFPNLSIIPPTIHIYTFTQRLANIVKNQRPTALRPHKITAGLSAAWF